MVDFRYHLVSLVSVFLALAVGIILGAGPLQGSLGNELSGQLDSLRASRDDMRTQLDTANTQLDAANTAVLAAGEQLTAGTLKGQRIGFAVTPDASDEDIQKVQQEITKAGGSVSGVVSLTEAFSDAATSSYRSTIADSLTQYLTDVPDNASTEETLGRAVATALRGDPSDSNVSAILTTLSSGDNPLIQTAATPKAAATAVVLVTPSLPADTSDTSATPSADASAAALESANATTYRAAFAGMSAVGPSVAIGGGDDDLLAAIRGEGSGSTVDSLGTDTATINTVLALGAELSGKHEALGSEKGADTAIGTRYTPSAESSSK